MTDAASARRLLPPPITVLILTTAALLALAIVVLLGGAVLAVVHDHRTRGISNVCTVAGIALPYLCIAICAAVVLRKGAPAIPMLFAYSASFGSMVLWWYTWHAEALDHSGGEKLARIAAVTTALAFLPVYTASLFQLPVHTPVIAWIRRLVIAEFLLSALGLLIAIFTFDIFPERTWFILLGVSAGGAVLGLILTLIAVGLLRFDERRFRSQRESLGARIQIQMTCPHCAQPVRTAPGVSFCPGCRRRFRVEVEEPRCVCGYLLYQLASPACPECGRPVPPELRWGMTAEDAMPRPIAPAPASDAPARDAPSSDPPASSA